MILTCPNCATRYQADASKFQPAGRNVRCAKCGHVWHQDAPPPEPDPIPEVTAEPEPPQPVPIERPQPQAFVPSPAIARETAPAPVAAKPKRPAGSGLALVAGWAGLAVLVLAVGWAALSFREQIATVWPQSASLYSAVGMKTHADGLDIRGARLDRRQEDGEQVIAVSGRLLNTSTHELPVPAIRVALIDDERRELFHWMIAPQTTTLRPGETTAFAGRLTSPPKGFSHFELRLAREGE